MWNIVSSASVVSIHHIKSTWKAELAQLKLIQLLCYTRGPVEGAFTQLFTVSGIVYVRGGFCLLKTATPRLREEKGGMMQTHWRATCCAKLQKHSWSLTKSCLKTSPWKTHTTDPSTHTYTDTVTQQWNISVTATNVPLGKTRQTHWPTETHTLHFLCSASTIRRTTEPLIDLMYKYTGSEVNCLQ